MIENVDFIVSLSISLGFVAGLISTAFPMDDSMQGGQPTTATLLLLLLTMRS